MPNFNYISGTSENLTSSTLYGVDVPLGDLEYRSPSDITQSIAIAGVDTELGTNSDGTINAGSISDRAPNMPSGYDVNGSPTYGDGPLNSVTVWASDNSVPAETASFTYAKPKQPETSLYSDLNR